ncbi:MAG: hypothetical protein AAFV53_18710 [Myxococcota bacterium]
MFEEYGIHVWVVSFLADEDFLRDASQGDGHFTLATDPADLPGVLEAIAQQIMDAY